MRTLAGFSLLLLTACASFAQVESAELAFSETPIPGRLFVDPTRRLGEISPYIFGTNYGPWSFVPLDLMPMAQQAGIRFIRFPGGDWGDENDMTEIQIDAFINLARQMNAEPMINVRLQGGSPETAAGIVQYVNVEMNYEVRYWGIGNEPQFYEGYTTTRFNEEWRAIAMAMQAVDPEIVLVGPEVSQFLGHPELDPRDSEGKLWVDEFLQANGDLVDIVSVHRYPFPRSLNSGPAQIEDLRANSVEWEETLSNLKTLVREITGRELPIAVTEFNSHWDSATGGEATPDSHFSAIWLADVIGRMIKQQVEIAAQFALQSASDNGGWGIFSRVEPRPSFYVYQMYSHFGDELVYSSSGISNVSIYSAVNGDQLTVLIINLSSEDVVAPLYWEGSSSAETELWLFDSSNSAASMGMLEIDNGETLSFPAESMSLYVFQD
jgi:hypothetical protein